MCYYKDFDSVYDTVLRDKNVNHRTLFVFIRLEVFTLFSYQILSCLFAIILITFIPESMRAAHHMVFPYHSGSVSSKVYIRACSFYVGRLTTMGTVDQITFLLSDKDYVIKVA